MASQSPVGRKRRTPGVVVGVVTATEKKWHRKRWVGEERREEGRGNLDGPGRRGHYDPTSFVTKHDPTLALKLNKKERVGILLFLLFLWGRTLGGGGNVGRGSRRRDRGRFRLKKGM